MGGLDEALAEAARLAKLDKGDWHPRYLDPQADFASGLLGAFMPQPAHAQAPTDLFAHAAWQQQLAFDRMAADLQMLVTTQGAQVRCLECAGVSGVPARAQATDNSSRWLSWLLR